MKHIIQKKIFEISTPSLATTHEWEGRMPAILRDLIKPTLEHCFDTAVLENQYLIIDRLEIDLGTISEKDYKNTIVNQLRILVPQALSKIQREAQVVNTPATFKGETTGNQLYSKERAALNAWLHFLQFGAIPWWSAKESTDWTISWLEQLSDQHLLAITNCVRDNPNAKKRLYLQFNDAFRARLVERILDLPTNLGFDLLNLLLQLKEYEEHPSTLRRLYWQHWIELLSENKTRAEQAILLFTKRLFIHPVFQQYVHSLWQFGDEQSTGGSRNLSPNVEYFLQLILPEIDSRTQKNVLPRHQPITDVKKNTATNESTNSVEESEVSQTDAFDGEQLTPLSANRNEDHRNENDGEEKQLFSTTGDKDALLASRETLFVYDAGLIILHPFLKELFTSCGFYKDQTWTTADAQHAAIRLLGWLARRTLDIPEYELVLHKLFCGMPIEEPLDTSAELTDAQLAQADELLEAVISHWKAIRNTSPDGLREGFFQRSGKLEPKDGGWKLTVERKAQDVLLSKLPWGLSLIQFPWLDGIRLHIDWN